MIVGVRLDKTIEGMPMKFPPQAWLAVAGICVLPVLLGAQSEPPLREPIQSGAPQVARKADAEANRARMASEAYENGVKALESNRFPEAAEHLTRATQLAPDDIASRFYLATALAQSGREQDAIPQYERLIELQPDVVEIRLNYGHLLNGLKDFADAAEQYKHASRLKPDDPEILVMAGYAELSAGQMEDAATHLEAALKLKPDDLEAQYGLAQAAMAKGDLERAESLFRKVAQRDAKYADSLLGVADAYHQAGNLQKAAALYGEFPQNAEAAKRAGALLVELGQAEGALAALQAAVDKEPSFANRRNLASAYLRASKPLEATKVLQAAVEAEPNNPEAHLALGRVLRDARRFPEAASCFIAALQLDDSNTNAWSEYAGVALLAGDAQAVLDAIGQIEKRGKLLPGHHYMRAIVLDRFQNHEMALQEYERFLTLSQGQNPDEEFKARQRVRLLSKKRRR
jgi:tetratricopeptide (TPR) repeat protein